jgi:hypothetical protein
VNETDETVQQETCDFRADQYDKDLTVGSYFKAVYMLEDDTFDSWEIIITRVVFKSVTN